MKTFAEINERLKSGKAVVLTAEEIIPLVREKGAKAAAAEVDVVTTATFGPMCSSGAFLNFGHSDPPIRMAKIWLNDVPAYAGVAAVDAYLGATELSETKGFDYGGAHVIEDLVAGKKVRLRATSLRHGLLSAAGDRDGDRSGRDSIRPISSTPAMLYQNYPGGGQQLRPHDLHVYGHTPAAFRQCDLFHGGGTQPAPERLRLPDDRHRHPDLPGRSRGLRGLGRHAAQSRARPGRRTASRFPPPGRWL